MGNLDMLGEECEPTILRPDIYLESSHMRKLQLPFHYFSIDYKATMTTAITKSRLLFHRTLHEPSFSCKNGLSY